MLEVACLDAKIDSLWSLSLTSKLVLKAWEGEDQSVVYNERSGDTHLIQSPGSEMLQLLAERPYTSRDLAVEISELFSDEDVPKIVEFVDATLRQLESVGLVTFLSR
jgi:PqqD family protein of HPr-rel-A system